MSQWKKKIYKNIGQLQNIFRNENIPYRTTKFTKF